MGGNWPKRMPKRRYRGTRSLLHCVCKTLELKRWMKLVLVDKTGTHIPEPHEVSGIDDTEAKAEATRVLGSQWYIFMPCCFIMAQRPMLQSAVTLLSVIRRTDCHKCLGTWKFALAIV